MKRKQILLITGAIVLLAIVAPIVFFYITTKLSSPKTIEVHAPETVAENVVKNDSSAITIYILEGDMIVLRSKDFVSQKMKLTEARQHLINKKDAVVIIKPIEKASYKLTVNVLDEMQVCGIKKYVIIDADEADKDFLKSIK